MKGYDALAAKIERFYSQVNKFLKENKVEITILAAIIVGYAIIKRFTSRGEE